MSYSSRLEGFYKLDPGARLEWLAALVGLDPQEMEEFLDGGLTLEQAERLVENTIGIYGLPLGLGVNFTINNRDYLIPMVIEEPSVVAGCSNAAKIVRSSGGYTASADEPVLVGQIQILFDIKHGAEPTPDATSLLSAAAKQVLVGREELLDLANKAHPRLVERGGGAREISVRQFPDTPVGPMLIVDLAMDTRDAMGANLLNTACEKIAPRVAELAGGRANLRILTNLADRRLARAHCRIALEVLGGAEVARSIVEAQVMAEVDRYRAVTHNKGVMNGIDAVALATGNDWRAIEAGAHAYAARDGGYRPLTKWEVASNGDLLGSIELPLAVGIVGGMTRIHRVAQLALRILGVQSGQELAAVMAAVGLAQNLAALRALATEGIQRGHMRLHARRLEGGA